MEVIITACGVCRFNAASLASTVVNNSPSPDEFSMINGVGDSSTFTAEASWEQPAGSQDLCYVGVLSVSYFRNLNISTHGPQEQDCCPNLQNFLPSWPER